MTSTIYLCIAKVLLYESLQGYPAHKHLCIGLLNWLSDIILNNNTELANKIRNARILISDDITDAISSLDELINDSSSVIDIPIVFMPREACYDCCIKHLSTAYTYMLANNKEMSIANLIEAYNEAPNSKDDFIRTSIKSLIDNPDTIKCGIIALIEFVDSERVKEDGV